MVQKPMEERGENDRKHVVKKCWTKHIENPRRGCIGKYNETWGKHDNDQRKMLGTNHAKSVGTWRKPEWLLGTNYDDAVNMLEKYSESAGKCDNNQRKWCKNDWKLKETGKTLGKIYWKCMKCRKREEMVQKAIEESGENGRKHVIKKAGQNTVKTYKREESNRRKR